MLNYSYSRRWHAALHKTARAASIIKQARCMRKRASQDVLVIDPKELMQSGFNVGKDVANIVGTGLYAVPGAAVGGSAGYLAGLLARAKNPGRWAALGSIAGGAAGAGYGAYRTQPLRKALKETGKFLPELLEEYQQTREAMSRV